MNSNRANSFRSFEGVHIPNRSYHDTQKDLERSFAALKALHLPSVKLSHSASILNSMADDMTSNDTSMQSIDSAGSTETSLGNVLNRVLDEELFHDVILKGKDGGEIGTNRNILGARSKVLERMLFGRFSEGQKKVIEIPSFDGDILKAVVEYCHRDHPQILNSHKKRKADNRTVCDEPQKLETLVTLAAAASFFDLSGLTCAVMKRLSQVLDQSSFLPLLLLDICRQQGTSVQPEIAEIAWSRLRSQSRTIQIIKDLEAKAMKSDKAAMLAAIGQETLGEILADDETNLDDHQRFLLLVKWAEANCDNPDERKAVAMELTRYISLENMSAQHLSSLVKPSGLVPMEKLLGLFEDHALANAMNTNAQSISSSSATALQLPPVWSNTKTHSSMTASIKKGAQNYGLLRCPAVSSGIHQWILQQVGESIEDLAFGVALAGRKGGIRRKGGWLFLEKGSWGFDGKGRVYSDGKKWSLKDIDDEEDTPYFLYDGGQVIVTLDLVTGGIRTLSAIVLLQDGGTKTFPKISLPEPVVRGRRRSSAGGFVPAVENVDLSGYRILSYRKLQD